MTKNVKLNGMPIEHFERRQLNAELRKEQRPVARFFRTLRSKLQQFISDERAINRKMETFLRDVDDHSIARGGWLCPDAYQPTHPGSFCGGRRK
jgi:uncharacterized protein (DUF2384 family)